MEAAALGTHRTRQMARFDGAPELDSRGAGSQAFVAGRGVLDSGT